MTIDDSVIEYENFSDKEKYPDRYGSFGKVYVSASSEEFIRQRDERERIKNEVEGAMIDASEHPSPRVATNSIETYPTGAVRDTPEGKPRYDLIDPILLRRTARHLQLGAEYYGEHNWTKGIPSSRYMASLLRHIEQYRNGERDEDHLAAAVFNIMGLMRNEDRDENHDLYDWGK